MVAARPSAYLAGGPACAGRQIRIILMEKIILYIIRFIFLGLISFESANLFGFLKFTLAFSWLGLVLTAAAVWFALEFLNHYSKKKYQYQLPVFIFLIPTFNILFDALGDIFGWYGKFLWYDQVAHFLSGLAAAVVIFFILKGILSRRKIILSQKFIAFISFLIANFFGILYEIEEYSESFFLHNNRLGDRFDTPNDLFFNMMGALAGVLLTVLIVRAKKEKLKNLQSFSFRI